MTWIVSTLAITSVAALAALGVEAGADRLATGQLFAGAAAFTGAIIGGIAQYVAAA